VVATLGRTNRKSINAFFFVDFRDKNSNLSDSNISLMSFFHWAPVHRYVHHCVSLLNFLDRFEYSCKISRLFNTGPSSILLVGNDLVLNVKINRSLDGINLDKSPSHHATAVTVSGMVVPATMSKLQ
jgi:hypothetical protein